MTTQQREVRVAVEAWPTADLEIRADGDGMTFHGYAAVFNSLSEDLGGFRERIEPGAFRKSLTERRPNIRMFLNHNMDNLLATTRAKTLTLTEDDKGLLVEASLPDTTLGRDTAALLHRGDIDSMSFGFQTVRDDTTEPGVRVLQEVRLWEVSPVTGWPAYKATNAFVRHLADELGEDPAPLEDAMRVLLAADQKLTPEQRDLLMRALNARTDVPVVGGALAEWRERFAAKGYAA